MIELKSDLGAQFNNPEVRVGFSVPIFYLGFVDTGNSMEDMEFNENILRYVLALAVHTDTPILIHLNGQQWAGVYWEGYGDLIKRLLKEPKNNMHTVDPWEPTITRPWYENGRQDISGSDINLTSPDLNWILDRDFQKYKERNLKQAICWLNMFRDSPSGHLLVGISLDSEIGMSSLYAAWPENEQWVDWNFNFWDLQVPFDYKDQFDYRSEYPTECSDNRADDPKFCTGGMRHNWADYLHNKYGGDLQALNNENATDFFEFWANHDIDSGEHFWDGMTAQNNPPVCQYQSYELYSRCEYLPREGQEPVSYNQHYIDLWNEFRQDIVHRWVQRVTDWVTCSTHGNTDHLHPCPLGDGVCTGSSGFPPNLVFTHQASDPDPKDYFCSPLWTAQVKNGQVGLTAYDLQAVSKEGDWDGPYSNYFQQVKELADGQDNRYRWGFFEWNPNDWDCIDPGFDINYQALTDIYNCGASIVCPYHWPNDGFCDEDHSRYGIRDTTLQSAIYEFLRNHPYNPCPFGFCVYLPAVIDGDMQCIGGELSAPSPPTGYPSPPEQPGSYPWPPTPTPMPSPTPVPTPSPTPTLGDVTPPHSYLGPLPSYRNASFNVTWGGNDDMSGIDEFLVQYRDGSGDRWTNWLSYPIPFFDTFENVQDGHTYYFRCRAQDNAGNVEDWPSTPDYDTSTTVDFMPPESNASTPAYDNAGDIQVSWVANDAVSGVDDTMLWYKFEQGSWISTSLSQGGVSGTFAFEPTGSGTYYFATQATDNAGNQEPEPTEGGDDSTVYDTVAPISGISVLPSYSPGIFTVFWIGEDTTSGIASYDVQVCTIECTCPQDAIWNDWITDTTATSAPFSGEHNTTYYFRSRARDNAGNEESYPGEGDTSTMVDALPPSTAVEPLTPYTTSISFAIHWSGADVPSGLDHYEIYYHDESKRQWQLWLEEVPPSTTEAEFEGIPGHTYHFCSRGVDIVGNYESCPLPFIGDYDWPIKSDAQTGVVPWSRVDDLPEYTIETGFLVSWSGSPDVTAYDIEVRDGLYGEWDSWLSGVEETSAEYSGQYGHIYYFRCRAARSGTDAEELYPYDYDTYTKLVSPTGMGESSVPVGPTVVLPPDEAPDRMDEVTRTHAIDVPLLGYIAPEGDVDWYRFELSKKMWLRISLYNLPDDYDIYVFDGRGQFLWASTQGYDQYEQVMLRVPAGVYYVRLVGYAGAWSGDTSYHLLVEDAE
ncbi:MAG: hypothetical protein JXA37_13365 [Chloroflexia bacterium]|nr:hypothetical protein [Chloroflexia bacterium]